MIVRSQVFETCASTNSATCPSAAPLEQVRTEHPELKLFYKI